MHFHEEAAVALPDYHTRRIDGKLRPAYQFFPSKLRPCHTAQWESL